MDIDDSVENNKNILNRVNTLIESPDYHKPIDDPTETTSNFQNALNSAEENDSKMYNLTDINNRQTNAATVEDIKNYSKDCDSNYIENSIDDPTKTTSNIQNALNSAVDNDSKMYNLMDINNRQTNAATVENIKNYSKDYDSNYIENSIDDSTETTSNIQNALNSAVDNNRQTNAATIENIKNYSKDCDSSYIENSILNKEEIVKTDLNVNNETNITSPSNNSVQNKVGISENGNDNEYEFSNRNEIIDNINNTIENEEEINTIKKRVKRIIDSDDEYTDNSLCNENEENKTCGTKDRTSNIIDDDSEEEDMALNKNSEYLNEKPIYCTDSKGSLVEETNNRSRLLAICDPETSDEEENETSHCDKMDIISDRQIKINKTKSKPIGNKQEKKITGRDALKLKKEIQSESQRRTRESTVTLPYHKPKSRTLKEFLQNRSRFAAAVPTSTSNTPPSLAMKMSTNQLKTILKKLSEREKEVKHFFKSESESEEEEEIQGMDDIKIDNTKIGEQNTLEESASIEKTVSGPRISLLQNILLNPCAETQNIHESVMTGDTSYIETSSQNTDVTKKNNIEDIKDMSVDDPYMLSNTEKSRQLQDITTCVENQNTFTMDIIHEINSIDTEETEQNSLETFENINNSMEIQKLDSDIYVDKDYDTKQIHKESKDNEINAAKLVKLIEKYNSDKSVCNISEDTNLGHNLNENKNSIEQNNSKNILDLVMNKFGDFKPELKGNTNEVIDLEDGTMELSKVDQLVNRFVKHTKRKSPPKLKTKLDIISLSGGEIHKETVEMSTNEEEQIPISEKPGERLKRLRQELQMQMAQKRSVLWQQKSDLQCNEKESPNENRKFDQVEEEDILDDEDEEELTDSEVEDSVEEDDNNDIKLNPKSVFLDDEAEESDIDANDINQDEDDGESLVEEGYHVEDAVSESENDQLNLETQRKKKQLKRIIRKCSDEDEDSSIDGEIYSDLDQKIAKSANQIRSRETQLDSTDTWDEYTGLTPNQTAKSHTPIRKRTQSKSELGFLTPVVQLTGLQSLNSGSKFYHESPVSPFVLPTDSSPVKGFTQSGAQKKLFADVDLGTTQELSEIAELCSGTFSSQSQELENTNSSKDVTKLDTSNTMLVDSSDIVNKNTISSQEAPSTQDLLEICSGKFTGITQDAIKEQISENKEDDNVAKIEHQQNLTQILINDEIKSIDAEDQLISELLNEEEMENFKRKLDLPTDITASGPFCRVIYDSSDEENNLPHQKKKKQKNFVFSDDEYSDTDEIGVTQDERIELCDEVDNVSDVEETQVVDYDSEENEINCVTENKPKKMKIGDYIEAEAELSESEWGSEDEDEGGLDELEEEEADNEKLDEEKVKRDLERIHMRRILDDDNEEVKILQELLLDDGELHGSGRERQFRWRNIDSPGNEAEGTLEGDTEVYLDEDENEEKWRKLRYEREVFLKKRLEGSRSADIEEDLPVKSNSQIIKLGKAAMQRSLSNIQNGSAMLERKTLPSKQEIKLCSTSLLSKRGSFLTRSDQVLERVAEFTKTLTTTSTKSSKNFIFQSVSESTKTIVMNKKRKATDGTPIALKKLRLNNFSPSVQKKQKTENSKAKKLFSVW